MTFSSVSSTKKNLTKGEIRAEKNENHIKVDIKETTYKTTWLALCLQPPAKTDTLWLSSTRFGFAPKQGGLRGVEPTLVPWEGEQPALFMTSQGEKGDMNRSRGRTFLIPGQVSSLEGPRRRPTEFGTAELFASLARHRLSVEQDDELLKILFTRQTCTASARGCFFNHSARDLVRITIIIRTAAVKVFAP